uniref:Rho GTPase activating protein 27 n=1 Tax=Pyxicephalus adspersus TaxID=30357 RepID=A0AAV3ADL3_PYXAD|nr:TPA: hypothetical protein GDO54_007926 [Pyxicephalus adspersus]
MQKASSADKDYVLVEHSFEYTAKDGTVVSIKPHERYILLKKTNEHWWQVCQDYKSKPFYIPAKYVKVLSPFSHNYPVMVRTSSEEIMDIPSMEYSYKFLPARATANANLQRFSIALGPGTHSLCDISVIREDPAEGKLAKSATGRPIAALRTFHNSKKVLDPLKRISYMCPPDFQPSIRPSQSLNDLQVIKPELPVPILQQVDSEQIAIQEGHVAGAQEDSPPEKVVIEKDESVYVNLAEFGKDEEKPRSRQHSSSSTIDDWETHKDQDSGQLFYYNSVTGETTWDCPFDQAEEQPISPASLSPASEDSNWEKHFDESSRQFYFHNPVTGETSWDPPAQDDLHPSEGKPMFSPYNSMDRRPPTPEADYPDYPSQEMVNYPEADYEGLHMSPPPYKAPSEAQLSGWSYHVKDGQKLYTNNNGDTWVQSQDPYGKTFFYSPDGSVSQWSLPPLRPPGFQRGHSDPNQNNMLITSLQNNYANSSVQEETEKQQSLITTPEHTVSLQGASLIWASKEKSSKKHVMELKTQDGSEYLIHHDSEMITADWFTSINKCIGKGARIPSETNSETELLQEFGSTEKLGIKEERRGQNNDSDRNVRAKLRKFLQRRPTLQSLRDKGYIRDQVFGCHLHLLCEREKRNVPQFVSKSIQAVERRGLDIDGLYRVSGNLAVIQKLRHKVDQDENFSLEDGKWEDVHVITGALKLFFRELPEPLFPFSHFSDFVEAITVRGDPGLCRNIQ